MARRPPPPAGTPDPDPAEMAAELVSAASIDLSAEPVPGRSVARPSLVEQLATQPKYDPDRDREQKRGQIAGTLVTLLVVLTSAPFLLILLRAVCVRATGDAEATATCGGFPAIDMKDLLNTVLTPVVALVGAATGFYFGEKKS